MVCLGAFALALFVVPALGGRIQSPYLFLPKGTKVHRAAVKDAFVSAYSDWQNFGNGKDDLTPLTPGKGANTRNGWGATTADALGTMKIMGLDNLYAEAVQNISKVDFTTSNTDDTVSFFETTIRYLGGMLSAYDLGGRTDSVLLNQSAILGAKLAHGWQESFDCPYNTLNFTTDIPKREGAGIAGIGTNVIEFYMLTLLSGNQTYQNLSETCMARIATNPAPLPGLAPQGFNIETNTPNGDYITWGGGSDSYYEYLIKYGRLTNNANPLWVETWKAAIDSSIRYLAKNASVGGHMYLTDYTDNTNIYFGSHLGCFVGGNWILGGKLLDNQTIVDYGLALTDACVNTYLSTATGIGPEVFAFIGSDGGNYTGRAPPSADKLAFYNKHGFYVYDGYAYYDLRPEVIESNFYAWRATGDPKYQDNAVAMMNAILKYCKTPIGYAPIQDVTELDSGFFDDTESFFFAEVLKYLYLTFDDPRHISLDDWVFNTEAHPFRAPRALSTYEVASTTSALIPFKVTGNTAELPAVSPNPYLPNQLVTVMQDAINGLDGLNRRLQFVAQRYFG